jgi:outer membrane protein insertion porin family
VAGHVRLSRSWRGLVVGLILLILCGMAFAQGPVVTEIIIHGNRRIPADTIRARIFTRAGDPFDEQALERDFSSLWNTGYFEDLRIEKEEAPGGYRIHIYVKEKPVIRRIEYRGLNSVSQSDVLDRFKERKVGLTTESPYDPTKVKKAEVAIKDLLAEHGRQFAQVKTEIHPIPPAAVEVYFIVKEGPKVKVGKIRFEGNKHISSRVLRRAMKNSRPIGIPHSIFLENIWSKTFDASKLSEDAERVRDAYQQKGYFKALVQDPQTKIRDTHPGIVRIPFKHYGVGKRVDITVPIEEGDRYRLAAITFKGNKNLSNSKALRGTFPIKDGDIFDTSLIRKGLENLRKAYAEFGYINFTVVPDTQIDDAKKTITLEMDIDEGKPYSVRRIEFQGNTTTRDKVIRRELALQEGGVYNQRLWEFSILRLNQLQYFNQIQPDQDTEIKRNDAEGTVDLTLKLKEKGKNSIGLTGGVSGLAGSFIGLTYETNNFLGLGETLQISASVGNQQRNLLFGFTEPYLKDRPLQFGFTVFSNRYNFDQARNAQILTNTANLNLPQNVLNTLQNYSTNSTGFTTSLSYPLHRSLKRVGITYSFDVSSVTAFSTASSTLFEQLPFRSVAGPSALSGVITSKVIPSLSFSSVDNPMRPKHGHSYYLTAEIAGVGGDVRDIRPIASYTFYHPINKDRNTLAFRVLGSYVTGFGGVVAPPFERFYSGGDNDLRGFDVRTISPVSFLPIVTSIPLTNPDGHAVPIDPNNLRRGFQTIPVPVFQIIQPGGDTNLITNVEYRIPIVGPVTIAAFADTGLNFVLNNGQLRVTDQNLNLLNTTLFGCPNISNAFTCSGGHTTAFPSNLGIVSGTNYQPRMSTGLELQVLMPIVNAPFRLYYAYNPLIMDTTVAAPNLITRDMFPAGGAGDFTYRQALAAFAPTYTLKEPRHTFRFTVSTTF